LAAEEEAEIKLRVITSRVAASDQSTGERETREAIVPSGSANMLESDVYSPLVGDAADLVANLLRLVIDNVVGAELQGFLELGVGTSVAMTCAPKNFAIWMAALPTTATRPENQDGFARLKLCARNEHVPRSLKHERIAAASSNERFSG